MNHSSVRNLFNNTFFLSINISATFCCLRCLTPINDFNKVFEDDLEVVQRTSMGTTLALNAIWKASNVKEKEELKKQYGLNGSARSSAWTAWSVHGTYQNQRARK